MPPYEDWNKLDEEEDEELQDNSVRALAVPPLVVANPSVQLFEKSHDVILFAVDCSRSMLALHDDPNIEGGKTSHLLGALNAAVQIQKRKVIVGPYDSVGIMFYNTVHFLSLESFTRAC